MSPRIAVISDIHAGLGGDDASLRRLQTGAVRRAADYLQDESFDTLILNGDTTDHLANSLSAGTRADIARDVLAPIVSLIASRGAGRRTLLLAGNTDWPVADPRPERRQVFFDHTGIPAEAAAIPPGGLIHVEEGEDVAVVFTHGHALKPEQRGHAGRMEAGDYASLWAALAAPDPRFLEDISAVGGAHRMDYLKAMAVGTVVKALPGGVRRAVERVFAGRFTASYEQHYAGLLAARSQAVRKRVLGVLGHTHVAGVRQYGGVTVLNTGTTGAKPNPLQRVGDPRAHVAVVDTEMGVYRLVETFNALRPAAKPRTVGGGDFSRL